MGVIGPEATLQGTCNHPGHGKSSAGMGDIVNLRRARKRAERQIAEQKASANRRLHGRSKAERELDAESNAKARRDLEHHRIETGDER
jgi:hypothetical protein